MTGSIILKISDLCAKAEGEEVLRGVNLTIKHGEIHAIMGPNGSGKSTLSHILTGREGYEITRGNVLFQGSDLLSLAVEERARAGLFLAVQYPIEIPGVSGTTFLKTAYNAIQASQGKAEADAAEFLKLIREKQKLFEIADEMTRRPVNVAFSGGEKKRFEMLQLALLDPTFAILDETDSGLDIDALKVVANGINQLRSPKRSLLLITHYNRLLDYVQPDFVHVLLDGKIIRSGDKTLAADLERDGYGAVIEAA